MSTPSTLPVSHPVSLRAQIRRGLDWLVLVGTLPAVTVQAIALRDNPSAVLALALTGTLLFVTVALVGVLTRIQWTPVAYVAILLVVNVGFLLSYGPLLGMGAVYMAAVTLTFLFLAPRWRWVIVGVLTVTPLLVGAAVASGLAPAPAFVFEDALAWRRTGVAASAALISIAVIIAHAVQQLVDGRREIERAMELEHLARRERDGVELEIERTRRADLIALLAAEYGADIGAALAIVQDRAASLARELSGETARSCLADVTTAANAAGSTMRSLTVFAPSTMAPEMVSDAMRAARDVHAIVRRVVPARIQLATTAIGEAWVELGSAELIRIITNLVLNARDAIAGTGTIAVTLSCAATEVILEVRDDGFGMDADTRARVFQPFFTTKPVGRGTGLGMATVKVLVDRAHGTITLHSETGHGTTFQIRLPRAPSPAATHA